MRKEKNSFISIAIAVAAIAIASYVLAPMISIVPGPEGPEVAVYGINPYVNGCAKPECILEVGESNSFYSVYGDTHNTLFRFEDPDLAIVFRNTLGAVIYAIPLSGEAQINVQPVAGPPAATKNITIEYVDENGQRIKKVYWLEAYDFVVEISTKPAKFYNVYDHNLRYGIGPAYNHPVDIWLVIGSVDLAPPPGAWSHRAKPVAVYAVDYRDVTTNLEQKTDGTVASNEWPSWYEVVNAIVVQPEGGGRKLDLWTSPYSGKATDYFENIGTTYKEALDRLPDRVFVVLTASRISTAYKTEAWYDIFGGYKWYVNYVFPVDVITLRVWFIREADYVIPEEGMPPDWVTETPSFGTEEPAWRGIRWDIDLFGFKMPVWVLVAVAAGIGIMLLGMRGGSKVVVKT